MSTANEPIRRMSTRGGAKEKMAKIVKQFCSGGITEDSDSDKDFANGGSTTTASQNDEGDNTKDIQPSTQTQKIVVTREAKGKPSKNKKAKKKKGLKATKKSSVSKEADAIAKRELASKLAKIKDKYLMKNEAAQSSHPRHWTGEVPERHITVRGMSVSDSVCTGQDLESKGESTHTASKSTEANALDDAGDKRLKQTPVIASHQQNINEKRHLGAVCAELSAQQEYVTPLRWPKPRRVQPDQPQLKSGAKTTLTDATHPQGITKKRARDSEGPLIDPKEPPIDPKEPLIDSEEPKTPAGPMDNEESDIDMEVIEPNPVTKKKTKLGAKEKKTTRVGAKGKDKKKVGGKGKKVAMPESPLQDKIKENRKEAPNLATRGNAGCNQIFETPATKKNIPHEIEGWTQGLAPPPSKRQRTSAANSIHPAPLNIHSASLNANLILMKTALPPTTAITKSAPCAIVVGSTTEVLTGKKKLVCGTKCWAKDLESVSDANNEGMGTVSNSYYRAPDEDKDDTLEQINAASSPMKALAAAWVIKESLNICHGITVTVQQKKPSKRQGNGQLPNSALDVRRWMTTFVPTFLQYVAGTNNNVWTLKPQDAVNALQAIWNVVYKGNANKHQVKIMHWVEKDGAIHDVSFQRLTEWRNSIGLNGLAVVGDFMDSSPHMVTTEKWQETADYLLEEKHYIYCKTRDVTENGETVVKKGGRYQGALVVQTVARSWVDFNGAVNVLGFVDHDYFPTTALVLGATAVHRALWLWANGYITKESHDNAKLSKSASSILKVRGQDGKFTKKTNFSKDQWEELTDMHMCDVFSIEPEKLCVIDKVIREAADMIVSQCKHIKTCKGAWEANQSDKKACGSGYQCRVVSSDSDV